MSALALPISALIPVVDDAKEETRRVVVCSQAERPDTSILCSIAWKTMILKWRFAQLTRQQERLILKLTERDFSKLAVDDIRDIVVSLDRLVEGERDLLRQVHQLGSEIRVWWNPSLTKLAEHVEHLDSIAESLHLECDDEASALLGMAVGQFAMRN